MFESQIHSLASITFLVQLIGIAIAVCYRLRCHHSRFNQVGMVFALFLIAASTVVCLAFDTQAGLTQGVTMVVVAVCATLDTNNRESYSGI